MSVNRIKTWLAACMLVVLLTHVAAQAEEPKLVTRIEGIRQYSLKNGLQILLFPDKSKPTVTVNMTVFVGSRHEGAGEGGMAHLLEHMLFKGTKNIKALDKDLQAKGARYNGTTSYDRTNYYETMPANDANLHYGIRMEADRLVNSLIRGQDLASEMTVVRNEFEISENNAMRVLMQKMSSVMFEWHNYGRATIGNRSDIERVPLPALRAFYRKYYQPDNVMLVVAGQFNDKKALEYIGKYFGAIAKAERKLPKTYTVEPPQDGQRSVTLRRVGDVQWVGAAYHICAGAHPDFAAIWVLNNILGTEPTGRMYQKLSLTKKAVTVISGAYPAHDPGIMQLLCEVRPDKSLNDCKNSMFAMIEEIGDKGVTAIEVVRAKQQFKKEREQTMADATRLAVGLSNWASQGDWRLWFILRDRIEKVTPKDVQRVAKKYLAVNNRTVGYFIPTKGAQRVTIPDTPDVGALVKNYRGRKAIVAGEKFDTSPLAIEARTTRYELGSGIKVALLPKKTRGETVYLNLSLRYGSADSLKGLNAAAGFLPTVMSRGTKTMTHGQIQDALDAASSNLRAGGSLGQVSFTIRSKRKNLAQAWKILTKILTEPSFPEKELALLKRQRLALYEKAKSEPGFLAQQKLQRALSGHPKGHVLYVPTFAESVARARGATVSQLKRLYGMIGFQGELSVVGDFDPGQARKMINELAEWKAKVPYNRIVQSIPKIAKGGVSEIQIPDKANAFYFAGMVIPYGRQNPDYAALMISNYVLGYGFTSRLMARVRKKEGLSYQVGSRYGASHLDPRSELMIMASSNPLNTHKVVTTVREELDKLVNKGVGKKELAAAIGGLVRAQRLQRTNDGTLATLLNVTAYRGDTMKYYQDLEAKISGLTVESVNKALKKYIQSKRLVVVIAGDFAKAAKVRAAQKKKSKSKKKAAPK